MNHPEPALPSEFVDRLSQIVDPSQLDGCLATFSHPPAVSFRVNTMRGGVAEVLRELVQIGVRPEPVGWYSEAFVAAARQRELLINSTAVREGRIYVQNLSSMLAPMALAPEPGEKVLDLAAAPGGKTLQMAAMMRDEGWISAVEAVRSRFYRLRENLRRHGTTIVRTYLTDGRTVGRKTGERFDRVLLDAPCSSEARFHVNRPESWAYWSERKIREQSRKQKGLLKSALRALKPGGTLVYCTCAFAPEENELVVDHQLRRFEGCVEMVPAELPVPNVSPGLTSWRGRSLHEDLHRACRVLPTRQMQALFLCKLRKLRA